MGNSRRFIGSALGVVAALSIAGGVAASSAVVVRPGDVAAGFPPAGGGQTWFTADTLIGGSVSLVNGPATPPLGIGSVQMTTTGLSAKGQLLNYSYIGTPLANFDAISYSTYRSSTSTNSPAQTFALNFEVDYNGPAAGGFTTLTFEPVYQSGGVGAMATDTWQTWDALNGGAAIWWSSKDLPNPGGPGFIACNPNGANAGTAACAGKLFVALSSIRAAFTSATIMGGVGLDVGSGWAGTFTGDADALHIGVAGNTTVYDFEPKTALTVTAPNPTKVQGDAIPTLTPAYSGFVFGDTAASLSIQPTCTTTATADSVVGDYAITCSGGASDNYGFTYVPGTLHVTARAPASLEPTQIVEAATGTPRRVTPPPTSANGTSNGGESTPLFALLICMAFGSLGLLVVQAQRRSIRR